MRKKYFEERFSSIDDFLDSKHNIGSINGTFQIVTRLLQCGALPKFDHLGRSVLHYAALGGNLENLELLTNVEPDGYTRCCKRNKTLLHYAAQGNNRKLGLAYKANSMLKLDEFCKRMKKVFVLKSASYTKL